MVRIVKNNASQNYFYVVIVTIVMKRKNIICREMGGTTIPLSLHILLFESQHTLAACLDENLLPPQMV